MGLMEISSRNFGEIFKEARKKKNLTQEQLAQKVGKKRSCISRVETDYGNNIKLQNLLEIVEKRLGKNANIDLEF